MIACTYCGRGNEDEATNCRECGTVLPSVLASESSSEPSQELPEMPALPAPVIIHPEALEAAFMYEDGFHRADWDIISRWIESNVAPLDAEEAWNEAALLWLAKLRDNLGGGDYSVVQSGQTILLCDQPLETARWVLDCAGGAATNIKELLGRTAWSGDFTKDVVLVFSDDDDYYQYLSFHSRDGEQPASGGVCIHTGCTHIALPWRDQLNTANAIVHELTHDCLTHLSLPLWLNEGVAVTLERAIAPQQRGIGQSDQDMLYSAAVNWRAPTMWDDLAERHFAFWNEENIQMFWAGTSFDQPGDSNELSYSLAEVLVKLLSERGDAKAFRAFLEAAHYDDAGQTAALDFLDADLGEIAATFLGEGSWRPLRKAMVQCWESAGRQTRGDDDTSAADGDAKTPG